MSYGNMSAHQDKAGRKKQVVAISCFPGAPCGECIGCFSGSNGCAQALPGLGAFNQPQPTRCVVPDQRLHGNAELIVRVPVVLPVAPGPVAAAGNIDLATSPPVAGNQWG